VTVRTFRVPAPHVVKARAVLPQLVHTIDGASVISSTSAGVLETRVKAVRGLEPFEVDVARWSETKKRLHVGFAGVVSEPFPDVVGYEARLMLYGDTRLQLEFMGRGRVGSDAHLPAPKNELLTLDIAGGRRTYLFRRLQSSSAQTDPRMARLAAKFVEWTEWIHDSDARLVVSLGGGGFRLFGAISAVKTVEYILGDRAKVDEVWGSSGGAFLGYLFSAGFPLHGIEQFAFDLYNGRAENVVHGTVASILQSRIASAVAGLRGRETKNETVRWLEELERRFPASVRPPQRPFYAIASSTQRAGLTALCAPAFTVDGCKDFMVGCHPHGAVAASTAVPFVVQAVRGIGEDPDEAWFDGSISDENPLALPYVKWVRERAANPGGTPSRLKIALISLNLRTSESGLLRMFDGLPLVKRLGVVGHGGRIVDMLLDSKTTTNIRLVTATPGVEVLECKLNLGWLSAAGSRDIARALRSGRTFDAWQFKLHGAAAS
jgi:hypothetical protein